MQLDHPLRGVYSDISRTSSCSHRWVRQFFQVLDGVPNNSTEGDRSLPSMLGGGDLDGDIYAVMQYEPLLDVINWTPAE